MNALALQSAPVNARQHQSHGARLVQAGGDLRYPEIVSGDVLHIDFDVKTIRHDGLYLIVIHGRDGSRWRWRCARRFMRMPGFTTGGVVLHGQDVAAEGWAPVPDEMMSRIEVFGEIREVFKPVSKLGR
ncbi:hypothetical protein HNP33_003078 [Comamonas odontotermitis]|uniref:Peptidase S24/S26A/S26B/S26C domain-containing protein n=1 Tax=Comamonas odontotermitis TaxID=379895 RepID=A0ABR6RII9_9BURK|nr:hypothetical protein [Comamonas odontotermitis]MBB6578973.1 hypothetical protein [Comamonas odontotermitis]